MAEGKERDPGHGGLDLVVEEAQPRLKKPPLYQVVLLNDDYTPMEFVVDVLQRIFSLDRLRATRVMLELSKPDKVNVGALGNIVTQLHVHVIGRFRSDPAWPGPVWGHGTRTPYPDHAAAALIERAATLFAAA